MAFVNCNCISRRMTFRRMTFRNHWKCQFFTGKLPFRMTLRMTLRNHWKCQLYTAILPLWMALWNANANDIWKLPKCKFEWHCEIKIFFGAEQKTKKLFRCIYPSYMAEGVRNQSRPKKNAILECHCDWHLKIAICTCSIAIVKVKNCNFRNN